VSAHTNEDGAFIAKGLLPEHYNVQAMPDRGAIPDTKALRGHVVSITLGDLDVQQKGFDLDGAPQKALHIVASTQYATISGTVLDPQGAPMANVSMYFQSNRPSQGGYSTTDDKGVFHAMLTEAGEYHVFVAVDQDAMSTQGEEYLKAHQGDFPVVHAILGENPPVTLVKNARPAQ
jgi:protocatechuate 3,4-dioxygenase beta subunit